MTTVTCFIMTTENRARGTRSSASHGGHPTTIRVFFDGGTKDTEGTREGKTEAGAGWITQTCDSWEPYQEPRWEMVLEVCCAIPEETRVTQALLLVASGAVKPVVSVIKHGKVLLFNFRGTGDERPIPSFHKDSHTRYGSERNVPNVALPVVFSKNLHWRLL